MKSWTIDPIGYIRSPFKDTANIPKGLGARHTATGELDVLPHYEAGLADIEGFSHLYILWVFHLSHGSDLQARPPSDDQPHGVFATRSPQRPNPIGLTVVELAQRRGRRLLLKGVDMLDGTPVVDIKPYLSSVPEAQLRRGWLQKAEARKRELG